MLAPREKGPGGASVKAGATAREEVDGSGREDDAVTRSGPASR